MDCAWRNPDHKTPITRVACDSSTRPGRISREQAGIVSCDRVTREHRCFSVQCGLHVQQWAFELQNSQSFAQDNRCTVTHAAACQECSMRCHTCGGIRMPRIITASSRMRRQFQNDHYCDQARPLQCAKISSDGISCCVSKEYPAPETSTPPTEFSNTPCPAAFSNTQPASSGVPWAPWSIW